MLELSEEGELTDERLVNITQDEYDAAMAELDAMTFGGQEMPEEETTGETAEEAAQERGVRREVELGTSTPCSRTSSGT